MDALTLRVNLDCLRKDSQAIINAKVGEANGRKVVFTLYEGRTAFFVPGGASVIFRAQKPDGTILYNNCVIDDGKVEYTITSQTVAVAGVYACELQIVSDGRIIYSPYVTLNVMDNLYADTEVESSNEFTELENALNKIPPLEVIYSKYTKPEGGIPKADLANDVQASLNKADTALQEHQSLAAYRTASEQDIIDSTKQDKLTAGDNITIAADGTISSTGGGAKVFFLDVFVITETEVITNKTYAEIKAAIDAGDIIYITDKNGIVYVPQVGTTNTEIELLWIESQYNRTLYWTAVVDSENAWSAAEFELVEIDKLVFELSDKVDKETGKGLSTNDYTAADKAKVEMISELSGNIGDLNDLDTEAKNNLVAAINEAAQTGGGGANIALRVEGGYIQYTVDGKTWSNLIAVADLKGQQGDPGKDGAPGKDGVAATVAVGTVITGAAGSAAEVVNRGTSNAAVFDFKIPQGEPGKDGSPGKDGADGITPTIGDNGNWYIGSTDTGKPSRGVAGATGAAGTAGKDGHTPVKGVDYWTAEDKSEIVEDTAAAIDLTAYAKTADVPTKTSQLTNDSGYLTLNTLPKYEGVVE